MIEKTIKMLEDDTVIDHAKEIQQFTALRDSYSEELRTAREYDTLAVEYLKCLERIGEIRSEPDNIEELIDAYGRLDQLHRQLNYRRKGKPGHLSDFKRQVLALAYDSLYGGYPRKFLEEASFAEMDIYKDHPRSVFEKHSDQEYLSDEDKLDKIKVCQWLANEFGIELKACLNILHTMKRKGAVISPLPSKERYLKK
jgi:hypothetical protein